MKINCGGFEIDENNFELDGKTLKLKNGGSGGGGTLVVHPDESGTLDKTWKEVTDAGFAVLYRGTNVMFLVQVVAGDALNPWSLVFLDISTNLPFFFSADSENDYPVYTETPIS